MAAALWNGRARQARGFDTAPTVDGLAAELDRRLPAKHTPSTTPSQDRVMWRHVRAPPPHHERICFARTFRSPTLRAAVRRA